MWNTLLDVCILNVTTLRTSKVFKLTKDLNVTFSELKSIVHNVFILGGDSDLSDRDESIIEGLRTMMQNFFVVTNCTLKCDA